jgi:uncharacterized membrane protein
MIAVVPIFIIGIFLFYILGRIDRHSETMKDFKEEK